MAKNAIPSYADLNKAIKAVADIPSKVDDEGFVIADGVSLTKNVYDPKNGNYELHVRDVKNNKWKSFDNYDNANCIEDAAKCFVDFYKARSTSESHKCSMAKKIESLSKKSEAEGLDSLVGIKDVKEIQKKLNSLGFTFVESGDYAGLIWGYAVYKSPRGEYVQYDFNGSNDLCRNVKVFKSKQDFIDAEGYDPEKSESKKSERTVNKDLSYDGFMTQWQVDVVDGLSSYMDMLGFNLDYNEEKNDPVHGTAARFDVTLDDGTDMGSIGPGYFHTYTDTSFTHSKPFSSRQFSNPADVVDKFVDLIKAYNSKPAESKKSEAADIKDKQYYLDMFDKAYKECVQLDIDNGGNGEGWADYFTDTKNTGDFTQKEADEIVGYYMEFHPEGDGEPDRPYRDWLDNTEGLELTPLDKEITRILKALYAPNESKRKGCCSMAKKIESLRKRSEGIDDVVNANDAAAKDKYNSGKGRYGKAQDILNFNTQHSDWKASKFLRTYVMDKYDVDWTTDHTKESYKLWFKDKRKVQDLINMFVEYRPKDGWNSNMSAKDFKIGRSVVVCPSRVELLIDDVYSNCPEWQQAFKEYLGTEVRAPIKDLKREVDYERSRSPEYNKFLTDIKDFKAELTDVIRNAVKLRTEVNYYPPRHEDDTEPFRVAIDGGFNDSASKSVTKVLNDLNAKYNPVPGGKRVDKDAAAEVLAALEASLS